MPTSSPATIKCVLFDLDGTLVDTAPDLLHALDAVLAHENLPPLDPVGTELARHAASHGSNAMLQAVLGKEQDATDLQRRRVLFLEVYAANICRHSSLFNGVPEVLTHLETQNIPWGIVTNKPAYLTLALLDALELRYRAASIISGDTLAVAKPHPQPLLTAAAQCGVAARQCLYVGDAERDMIAGRHAGMTTLAALWGYIAPEDVPHAWQADGMIGNPADILAWID